MALRKRTVGRGDAATPARADAAAGPGQPWIGLAIAALAFVVFIPAYAYDYEQHEGFVWDDDDHYLNDHLVRADDGWWRIWFDPQPAVVGEAGGAVVWNYWPLTRMTFWIERRLWGLDPRGRPRLFGSHVVNVGLHAANAVLVLVLLRRLQLPGAELAALLFAVHPVGVESVAWITQRKALLSTLLFLVSLAGWLRFTASGAARWYLFTSTAFLLALMAKTTTVMFPVVLVLLHWYQQQPWTRRAVLRLAPFFAMALVAGVTSIVFERFIGSTGEAWSASVAERIAAAGMIVWFYLGKLILPLGLSFNYPRWQIDETAVASYLPSAAVLAVAALLWRFRRGWARPWILALGCFLVNLFPVLGFLDVYGMRYAHVADHWQYLASISVLALEAGLIASTPRWIAGAHPRLERAARAACVAVSTAGLAALAWLTWQQAGAYVDGNALWRHTLARHPDSLIANNNLGTQLLDEGRPAEAIAYFRKAIEADPTLPEGYLNLGNALDASGQRTQAPVYWRKVLEIDPAQPIALHNLAVWDMNGGRLGEAEALLVRALEADPKFGPALDKLGRIYRRQGRPQAIAPFVLKARQPPSDVSLTGGRRIAFGVWSAMAIAWGACGWVAAREPQDGASPSHGKRRSPRVGRRPATRG